ncbi:hypothetical protein GGI42DRAFT_199730 [Trichoderma sp. SZMC 28013]
METAQAALVAGSTVDAAPRTIILWRQSPCVGICSQPRWRRRTGHIYWSHLNQEREKKATGWEVVRQTCKGDGRDRPWIIMDGEEEGGGGVASELEAAEMEETRTVAPCAAARSACMKQGQEPQRTNEVDRCLATPGFWRKSYEAGEGGAERSDRRGACWTSSDTRRGILTLVLLFWVAFCGTALLVLCASFLCSCARAFGFHKAY